MIVFFAIATLPISMLLAVSGWFALHGLPSMLRLFAASISGFVLPFIFGLAFFLNNRADLKSSEVFEVIGLYLMIAAVLCVLSACVTAALAALRRR